MAFKRFFKGDTFVRYRMKKLIVVSLLTLIVGTVVNSECNYPSSLWCSSDEISKRCNVYEQCQSASRIDPFAGPVNLTLYFESLCPDCQDFFRKQLNQTWYALGTNVLNVTLVPYGNAIEWRDKTTGKWMFQCQHGKQECIGNMLETCAINILGNIKAYFPFVSCMENEDIVPNKAAKKCANDLGIDIGPIMECANSDKGNMLEHEMALQTIALNPMHKYVPWITINGVHTEKMQDMAQEDLLSLICETYKGTPPKICLQLFEDERTKHQRNYTLY